MYLFDSKKQSTNIRIKDGKEIPFKSTKTFHHFKCDNCGTDFERAKNGKLRESQIHFCSKCPTLSLSASLSSPTRHKKYLEKGYKNDRGYKEIFVGPEYPYRKSGWVREHIIVMEKHIGKKIPKGMVVHHIDGDKQNNNIDNLLLCTVQEHNNCHAKIEQMVFDLVKQGLVSFDRNTQKYVYVG